MRYSIVLLIGCSLNVYCMESPVSRALPSKESIIRHEKLFEGAKNKYNAENNLSKKRYYYYLAKQHFDKVQELGKKLGEQTSIVFDMENIYVDQSENSHCLAESDETSNLQWVQQILFKNKSTIK